MLNLFQHLITSVSYETLKQVKGDSYGVMQRSLKHRSLHSWKSFYRSNILSNII